MIDFHAFSDELMKIAAIDVTKLRRLTRTGPAMPVPKNVVSSPARSNSMRLWGNRRRGLAAGKPVYANPKAPAPTPQPQAGGGRFLGHMPGDATYEKRLKAGLNPTGL